MRFVLVAIAASLFLAGCRCDRREACCDALPITACGVCSELPHSLWAESPLPGGRPVYEPRQVMESYWAIDPTTGELVRLVRQRMIYESATVDEQSYRDTGAEVLTDQISLPVMELAIDVQGVNVERLRQSLLEVLEGKLNGVITDQGQTQGDLAQVEVKEQLGDLVLVHAVAARVNASNDRLTIQVATRGFKQHGGVLLGIPQAANRERATQFAARLRGALTEAPES